jgi:hypothetical protein
MPNKYKVHASWTVECEIEVDGKSPIEAQEKVYSMGINELRAHGNYNDYVNCSMFVDKIEKVGVIEG